jgi:transcriptional regulator with XRE-family HTH domain
MKSENLKTRTANELGALLRHWRDVRGKSQFDLSLDAGVSQKQISFVESGRSVPNRQTLVVIAQALDVPLRDRNTLLLAGGYAPIYSESDWDSMEMKSVTDALKRILRQQEPFPAMVNGSLLVRAHDERMCATFLQLLHRYGCVGGAAKHTASSVRPKRNAPVRR